MRRKQASGEPLAWNRRRQAHDPTHEREEPMGAKSITRPESASRYQPVGGHGHGQQVQIGYSATAVVFSFCTFTTEIFFMKISP